MQVFKNLLERIYLILKQNYFTNFYKKVLQIPTKIYKEKTCFKGLRFNSIGPDIEDYNMDN